MFNFLGQRSWKDVVPSNLRTRQNRRRQLDGPDHARLVAALQAILKDRWLPLFVIISSRGIPKEFVETQIRRILDEGSVDPDPVFRMHTEPGALPANYWTVIGNQKPFGRADIIIRRKRRDKTNWHLKPVRGDRS